MATIIEVQDQKIENLSEYAEKILKYGGKLMQCLEEMSSKSHYMERSSYNEPPRKRKKYDDEDYLRYY